MVRRGWWSEAGTGTGSLLHPWSGSPPRKSPEPGLGDCAVSILKVTLAFASLGRLPGCSLTLSITCLGSFSLPRMGPVHIEKPLPSGQSFLWGPLSAAVMGANLPRSSVGSLLPFLWSWPPVTLKSLTVPLSSDSSPLRPAPLASYTLKGQQIPQRKRCVTGFTRGCTLFGPPPLERWSPNSPPLEHGLEVVICF